MALSDVVEFMADSKTAAECFHGELVVSLSVFMNKDYTHDCICSSLVSLNAVVCSI